MAICGKGWSQRCREANPNGECRCSCGGINHGVDYFKPSPSPVPVPRPRPIPPAPPVPPVDNDDGEIIPLERREWPDTALDNKDAFARALREIGLHENLLRHGLYRYDSAVLNAKRSAARASGINKKPEHFELEKRKQLRTVRAWLVDLLGRRRHTVIETTDVVVKLPIFRLHSPKIERSKVSYIESQTDGSAGDCVVTIFGTGMGATQSFAVKYTNTFVCSNGGCKLIYVPVTIKAERIEIFEGKEFLKEDLRTEMVLTKKETISKCIESIPEYECSRNLVSNADFDEEFDYSGDRSNDIHKVEWSLSWKGSVETKLGLTAFNIKTECRATITYEKAIGFVFELPAGHKYGLKQSTALRGISWTVDHQSKKKVLIEESTGPSLREPASPERNSDSKKSSMWRSLTASIDALWRRLRKKQF